MITTFSDDEDEVAGYQVESLTEAGETTFSKGYEPLIRNTPAFEQGFFEDVSVLRLPQKLAREVQQPGAQLEFCGDYILLNGIRYPCAHHQLPYPVEAFEERFKVADVQHISVVDGSRPIIPGENRKKNKPPHKRTQAGREMNNSADVRGTASGTTPGRHKNPADDENVDLDIDEEGNYEPPGTSTKQPGDHADDIDEEGAPPTLQQPRLLEKVPDCVRPQSMGLTNVRRPKKKPSGFTDELLQEAWVALEELATDGDYSYCEDIVELDEEAYLELRQRHRAQEWFPPDDSAFGSGADEDDTSSSGSVDSD
ncbi:unnamed protein product [Amoebophrya sp. A120]|nr:unnamed protein product [Amoebophrya sp. A120]|eukprot:GSA120T00012736001.1